MTRRRRRLSDRQVRALKPGPKRRTISDGEVMGLYVRIMPSGVRSYVAVSRDPFNKQIWVTLGTADLVDIQDARDKAREVIKRIKAGLPPVEAPPVKPDSFEAVANNWLKRHVEAKGLRTRDEIERVLRVYTFPHWRDREFESLRRSDVARLLDFVEDNHGRRQADVALSIVRAIGNWYATRNDDYVSPFVRGMSRTDPGAGRRDRILNDDEIRALWKATETVTFGGLVRMLLLTAQRLGKVRSMRWGDIDADTWNIPTAPREKGNAGKLVLPEQAVAIIRAQPRIEGNPFVFAGRSDGHISNMTEAKHALDAKLPPMPPWVLHDLRRTARSLMSRAGVPSDHAERTLGHTIKGIEGIYDHHDYGSEKRIALERLANLIEQIVNGVPSDKIVPIRARS